MKLSTGIIGSHWVLKGRILMQYLCPHSCISSPTLAHLPSRYQSLVAACDRISELNRQRHLHAVRMAWISGLNEFPSKIHLIKFRHHNIASVGTGEFLYKTRFEMIALPKINWKQIEEHGTKPQGTYALLLLRTNCRISSESTINTRVGEWGTSTSHKRRKRETQKMARKDANAKYRALWSPTCSTWRKITYSILIHIKMSFDTCSKTKCSNTIRKFSWHC